YVGADFMQITGPGVWFPSKVEISVSDDGKNFTTLTTIEHKQKDSTGLSFKEFSWSGNAKARYVRYCATSTEGCQFTDEIIVR
ncbi:MAG: discoidin domain-containing protein, partial [Paramuribaculum sp.]|nr:discoidin domain-containing protein [Paramuribaculum sp.]